MNEMTRHTLCEACQKDCRECPMSDAAWLTLVVVMALLGIMTVVGIIAAWAME